jgi:hypothetical protein
VNGTPGGPRLNMLPTEPAPTITTSVSMMLVTGSALMSADRGMAVDRADRGV